MPIINSKIRYAFGCLIFVCFLAVLLVSCLETDKNAEDVYKYDNYLKVQPDIRVLLHNNIKEIQIEIKQPYSISNFKSDEILAERNKLVKSVIYLKSGDFRTRPLTSDSTHNAPTNFVRANGLVSIFTNSGCIKLNKSTYCGKLILVPKENDKFSILEEIGVEEYLPGVIEGEMPIMWNDDALQAQVIAIRTYAIYKRKTKANALYHINKLDLAYKGSYMNQAKTKEIVDKTRGTVMVYDWKLFPGYFHSTCGGHTEDINLVFNLKSIPPLSGVDCGYCNNSKYYHWKKRLGKIEIQNKLKHTKAKVKKIRKITTEDIGPGGHCSTIKIDHAGGTNRVNANDFRLIIGPNNLRSTSFSIKNSGNSLIFEGSGWGHGVGLCQYGTQSMAKSGFRWYDILRHYYPEIDLVKIY
ncbi:MAG: SpoIID/LytB domain-containing protein [Candidatus Scalindua sp.]|nr:SpoIID/LytB domain-containing protein [Candidatus Scalindua sp.]